MGELRRSALALWLALFAMLTVLLPMPARHAGAVDRLSALQAFCGGSPSDQQRHSVPPWHDHAHCLRCSAAGALVCAVPPDDLGGCSFSGVVSGAAGAWPARPHPRAALVPYLSRAPPPIA